MTKRIDPHRPAYKKRSEYVWDAVRRDYLAGMSAAECARRHDVTTWAIAWRAKNHGWRKIDHAAASASAGAAWPSPPHHDAAARPPAPQTPDEAARAAFANSARALAEGRPGEAQTWASLARSMSGMRLPGDGDSDDPPTPDDDPYDTAQYRSFRPGIATAWDNLTLMAEKRLDMLFRDFWTGGPWDSRWNKPAYCMDRDGRIVRTCEVPDSWFDGYAEDAERREWMNTPLPVSEIAPPPLGWIVNVWLPDWNQRHPDDPCTEADACMVHQLYTRCPRLEWGYNDPKVQLAKARWEAEQREKGAPLPVIKAPWTDNDERRRREREAGVAKIGKD